jgi:hypothetical protein
LVSIKFCWKAFFYLPIWTLKHVHINKMNCELMLTYDTPALRQSGSRNMTGQKTLVCTFFVTFFSATIDGRDLIFVYKLHIGTPYRGKHFWTHQIPTSCLPTLLIFIHIEHTFCICPFFVAFFSATIDGRNLIFGHKRFLTRHIPTSWLPKSRGIISEH